MSARIGKPQKSKKHKKLKQCDPFYKGKKTEPRIEINQRPANDDIQEIPNSLKEIMRARQALAQASQGKKKRKLRGGEFGSLKKVEKGMTKPLKPVPNFRQKKNESEHAFLARVDRQTFNLISKRRMEEKYKVDLEVKESGETVVHKRKKGSKDDAESTPNKKKRRLEIISKKKKWRKNRKSEDLEGGFEELKDEVLFGDVAMEPPLITAKPRKALIKTASSKISSLKMNLPPKPDKEIKRQQEAKEEKIKIGKVKKRKHLAPAEKVKQDLRRDQAIAMYREMKQNKGHKIDFTQLT